MKYKTVFAKSYTPNWSEKVFIIKKVKNTASWTYVNDLDLVNYLNSEEIVGMFFERNCKKQIKQFRAEW